VLLTLGYALAGPAIAAAPPVTDAFDWLARTSWAALLHQLGTLTSGLLVPVVGGYVAYAIADRPALVPGFVGGGVAVEAGAGVPGRNATSTHETPLPPLKLLVNQRS
jgi:PTS system fructose-specific IIC component